MRAFNWNATPLGAEADWPVTLKVAVRTLLDCQLPMYLAWGDDHLQFYNDAYRPILGDKHEGALGNPARHTWNEIWPMIGPMWADVMQGAPIGSDDFKLTINRYGYMEDCYFNFSYSPVPGDTGEPAGILVTFAETTSRVLAERRQAFQLQLADALRDQYDSAELLATAARLAGHFFAVDRVGYGEVDAEQRTISVARDWFAEHYYSLAGETRPLDSFGPDLVAILRRGGTLVINDVASDPRSQAYAPGYASIGVAAIAAVPLLQGQVLQGVLYLHSGTARRWSEQDISLIEDVGRRISDAVRRARAESVLREETGVLELLNQTGQSLNSTLDIDALVQSITDAATKLAGAQFGSFFYNGQDTNGDALMLYALSGAPRSAFENLGHPRPTAVFSPTFHGHAPIRSDDIRSDARYGSMGPHFGMPPGHLPVVSYLAVSVVSKSGAVLGGLFFGHPEPAKFSARTERIIEGIAAQAAIAIDNARLYDTSRRAADERQELLASERLARAEAERLSRSKDEFLAMLAHELRNPLAPVSAAAELLKLEGGDEGRVLRAANVIARQVSHLTHLIDDLMDVSRVTRGLVDLNMEPLPVATVVGNAIEQIKPMLQGKSHALTIDLGDESASVNGDRTRLVQVVANLLNNAAKYTPAGGHITLNVALRDGQVQISVEDNGCGIDGELLPYVFDMFTQGSRRLDRGQGGLGIGLALVRAIVNLHGGTVTVHSDGIGCGSTFTVSLPEAQSLAAPGEGQIGPILAHTQHILIVDDNVDAADSLSALLAALGHRTSVRYTAQAALDAVAQLAPDACVLDIGLPDMSGYELAVALRQLLNDRDCTLIAVTGYGQPQDRKNAFNAGFDHHFAKPVNAQQLLQALAGSHSSPRHPSRDL